MIASQNHGFKFEDMIIEAFTGLKDQDALRIYLKNQGKRLSYTAKDDIPPGIYPKGKVEKPISVKTSMKNTKQEYNIGLGDYLRNAEAVEKGEDKIIIVGAYNQKGDLKIIDEVCEIDWNHEILGKKGFCVPTEKMRDFDRYVKSIPAGKQAQLDNQKVWKEKRQKLLEGIDQICGIDAKIDGKTQRRVQSSIKSNDVKNHLKHTIYKKEYNRLSLPITIRSGPRKRNKK